jgi:hypothetical protein
VFRAIWSFLKGVWRTLRRTEDSLEALAEANEAKEEPAEVTVTPEFAGEFPDFKTSRPREVRMLWRDEAVLGLLQETRGGQTTDVVRLKSKSLGWRFNVRTHLRRLAKYGLVEQKYARANGGSICCYWCVIGG